jgi:hypothetical protein
MTTSALPEKKEEVISLQQAARELGCARKTMDYYKLVLGLQPIKLPLDNNLYLTAEDFTRVKELREAAARRRQQ